jgi:hypothetical protein
MYIKILVICMTCVRPISSYSQRIWVVHFLQNLFACGIVILPSFLISRRKFLLTCCSLFRAIVCQSATSGTLRNISQANAREPGALLSIVVTLIRIACIAVDNTSYTMSLALEIVLGGLPCINTLNTFSTV